MNRAPSLFRLTLAALFLALSAAALRAEEGGSTSSKRNWKEYFRRSRATEAGGEEKSEERRSTGGADNPEGMVDLIDSPTPNVIDYGAYRLNFRFYNRGGVQSHIAFGVFRRLNIGATWDNEQLIGSEDPTTHKPTINAKFRIYDGGEIMPALAIGYDGQGRFFDKALDEYVERERGLYAVMGREILIPHLQVTGGANIAQFKESKVLGFFGFSYTIEDMFVLMAEYDNIRTASDNRFNAGLRIFPIPSLGLEFSVRRIGSDKEKERILRINFVGSF